MRIRTFIIGLLVGILSLALVFPSSAQSRWDGADNLPVNPLSCPGEGEDDAQPAETPRYDGSQPANPPNLAGQPITVVDARQPVSDAYDRALEQGMNAAARELGSVQIISAVSSVVGVSQQGALAEFTARGVNGILFTAVDGEDIAPSLRAALRAGIRVVGYGSDTERGAREWFVQPAAYNAVAKALVDSYVQQTAPDAGFAVLTTTFDSPQAGRWISEMWAYATQCYPRLEWLETVETQDDAVLAYNQATLLMNDYGSDVSGFISVTTAATPNVAQAISQSGLCSSRVIVGLATPNEMKPSINSGCVQAAILWEPADLGYAAVYVMRATADGTLQPGDTEVDAGRLGTLPVENGSEIVLGPPLIFNARNINDLNF